VRGWACELAVVLTAALAGCGARAFSCDEPQDCRDGGAQGICQPEGVCSFPDPACESGQRYGEHSGASSGRCVPAAGTSGVAETHGVESNADGLDTSPGELSSVAPGSSSTAVDTSGDGGTTSSGPSESSTGEPADPSLLLWFTFDDELADGLDNSGSLGGAAACSGEGCPSAIAGAIGAGGSFDGLDDCGVFEHVPALAPTQFTLAMWARREVTVPGFDGAFTKPVGKTFYNTWRMTVQSDDIIGEFLNVHVGTSDDSGVDSNSPLPFGVWVHFAATWTGDNMTSYVDGVLFESLPSTLIEVDEQAVLVGCDDDHDPLGLSHFLHGALDDVRMYDRVLDEQEIAELHAMGMP
jgi:Concanavalin A-like lectin/glucanases superfamily